MLARMRRLSFLFGLVFIFAAVGTPGLQGQIHGVPASITSFGFGGSTSRTPGFAASVTSLGPNGFGGGHSRFGNCCFNPFFQTGSQSPIFVRGRHSHRNFFGGGLPIYSMPYSVPYTQVVVVQPDGTDDEEDYDGGPTIFDRRESHYARPRVVEPEPAPQPAAAVLPPEPVVSQPSTVVVFRDGHQTELQNYAIVGDTLFDLTDNRSHKIQLADLDLAATRKANDARGVEFQVPDNSAR
jgi:hypothetical protein